MITHPSVSFATAARRAVFALSLVCAMSPAMADSPSATQIMSQAAGLMEQERFDEAYRLLDKGGADNASDPDYDYLLGVAALRAGKPEQAVFALERVVQVKPGYAAARMELVSAYMQLGLDRQAQQQLEILETQSPPEAAREAMSQYRDILRPRLTGTPEPVRLIGLSAGYDSNAGSFPTMDLELGPFLLEVDSIESSYSLLRGTWWEPVRLNEQSRLDFTFYGQMRNYRDEDARQFDLGLVHGGVLLNNTVDSVNKYSVGLQMNKLWLDDSSFRDHVGANMFWDWRIDAGLSGRVGVKFNGYRFDEESHDYNQFAISGELAKAWSPRVNTALLLDLESEEAMDERVGGDAVRTKVGAKLGYRYNSQHQADVRLSWARTRYSTEYDAYTLYNPTEDDKTRVDESLDLTLGWRYLPAESWEVATDYTYHEQDSSVRFYELDRWTAQLSVLRYF
ncbi:MAG: tetratricopeptide repeat protein [Pseudomonadota bacterium]